MDSQNQEQGPYLDMDPAEPKWRSSWLPDTTVINTRTEITTTDLMAWSYHVAKGMEFLGTRKVGLRLWHNR